MTDSASDPQHQTDHIEASGDAAVTPRPSQLQTLSLAIHNGLSPRSVARNFDITERSAQRRLDRLTDSGHLELEWDAWWLTEKGRAALGTDDERKR